MLCVPRLVQTACAALPLTEKLSGDSVAFDWFPVVEGKPFLLNGAYDSVTFHAGTPWCRSFVVLCSDRAASDCPTLASFNTSYTGELQTTRLVAGGAIGLLIEDALSVSVACAIHFPGRRLSQLHRCDLNVCFGSPSCTPVCDKGEAAVSTTIAPHHNFQCVPLDNRTAGPPISCTSIGTSMFGSVCLSPNDNDMSAPRTNSGDLVATGLAAGISAFSCLVVIMFVTMRKYMSKSITTTVAVSSPTSAQIASTE